MREIDTKTSDEQGQIRGFSGSHGLDLDELKASGVNSYHSYLA
jgi:hypothetical protein